VYIRNEPPALLLLLLLLFLRLSLEEAQGTADLFHNNV